MSHDTGVYVVHLLMVAGGGLPSTGVLFNRRTTKITRPLSIIHQGNLAYHVIYWMYEVWCVMFVSLCVDIREALWWWPHCDWKRNGEISIHSIVFGWRYCWRQHKADQYDISTALRVTCRCHIPPSSGPKERPLDLNLVELFITWNGPDENLLKYGMR